MDVATDVAVRPALRQARLLAADPWTIDLAIGALEEVVRSLEPAFAVGDVTARSPGADRVRTVLSTHLLAVRALRDVEASDAAVARIVVRAVDEAERALAAPPAGPGTTAPG